MSLHECPPRRPRAIPSRFSARQLVRSTFTVLAALVFALGSFAPVPMLGQAPVAYAQAGEVTVTVFRDSNRDGIYSVGEPLLQNVPVALYSVDDRLSYSNGTNAQGEAKFTGVTYGDYRAEVVSVGPGYEQVSFPPGHVVSVPGASFQNAGLVFPVTVSAATPSPTFRVGLRQLTNGQDPAVSNRSVTVRVWDDLDADGIQDANEPGLSGLTLVLTSTATLPVTATPGPAGSGRYHFSAVPAAAGYYVSVTNPPAGYVLTRYQADPREGGPSRDSDAVRATGLAEVPFGEVGVNLDTIDIGYTRAAISGYIFRDVNANGFNNGGVETRLDGIVVELLNSGGTPIMTTTTRTEIGIGGFPTGEGGVYSFTGIAAGDYFVRVPGSEFTAGRPLFGAANSPTDLSLNPPTTDRATPDGLVNATVGVSIPVTVSYDSVPQGSNRNTNSIFGFYKGSVGDFVWYDRNRDGLQTGEELDGQSGIRVFVDADSDGIRDTDELSTTTGANGFYLFSDLPLGQAYTITLDVDNFQPLQILDGIAVHPTNALSATLGGVTYYYTRTAILTDVAPSTSGIDFGLNRADVGNRVFVDANGNGVFDPVEEPIPGVTVELRRSSDDELVISSTTTITGSYTLPDLRARGYYAVFDLTSTGSPTATLLASPKLITTTVDPQNALIDYTDLLTDSIAPGRWSTPVFTPTAGVVNNGVDAGFYALATLSGRAFFDTDGDERDEDPNPEPGMRNVTVNLRSALTPGAVISTTATLNNATGAYTLANVRPGTYVVDFVNPVTTVYAVITGTTAPSTTGDILLSDVETVEAGGVGRTGPVTLFSGTTTDEIDAGFRGLGTAGGRVFTDRDGDDRQGSGDTSLPNATVALTVTANLPNLVTEYFAGETTTDAVATGNYTYTLLPFGTGVTYTLAITAPDAVNPYLPSVANVNGNTEDSVDSDGPLVVITNPTGSADADQGFYQEGTITARVFEEIEDDHTRIDNQYDPTTAVADEGIPLVSVTLRRSDGTTFPGESDAQGLVTFKVKPGYYQLDIDQTDDELDPFLPSEPEFTDPVSITGDLLISDGTSETDTSGANSFGYYTPATLTGVVFFDRDLQQDKAGEPGVQGVGVTLTGPGGTRTTSTDENGVYTFTNLLPADALDPYTVTFTNPDVDNFVFFSGGDSDVTTAGAATPVLLAYGTTGSVDAGLWGRSQVVGSTFVDADADGRSDGTRDGPLGDVTVTLTVTVNIPNRLTTQIVRTETTLGAGNYSFASLPGGGTTAYTLTFEAPDATWVRTESDVNGNANDTVDSDGDAALRNQPLGVSDTDEDRDQGYYQNVTVTARVFEETTGAVNNRYVDPDDREIENVTVTLERAGGGTTTLDTDANGLVSFTVKPGSYQLNISENDAQLNGLIASPGNTDPISVTTPLGNPAGQLFSGDESLTDTNGANSFGYYTPATLTGVVFFDRDLQQDKAGEPGVRGVEVTLTGPGGTRTTNTDASGVYTFTNLLPADALDPYTVTFTNPDVDNFVFFSGGDSDVTTAGAATPVLLAYGATGSVDAGLWGRSQVVGSTFVDADADGRSDGTRDGPLGDVTVTLTVTVNIPNRLTTQIVRTETTLGAGNYSFASLPGGGTTAYTLTFAAPDTTWVRTESDVNGNANDTVDSDGDAALRNQPLGVSDVDEDRDQGYYQNVTVTARVFEEITGAVNNRYVDPDDREIENVTVTLERAGGGTTTLDTDANGLVSFTVKPGSYQLNISENDAQLNGLIASPGNTDPISVTTPLGNPAGQLFSGDESLTDTNGANSFGYYTPATLTGVVFFDRDLQQDKAGEPGVRGVEVTLTGPGGTRTTTTDATGLYTFTNLLPADALDPYTVTFTNPDVDNFVFFSGGDSDVTTAGEVTPVLLAYGATGSVDAGLWGRSQVVGSTFVDADADGRSDGTQDGPLGDVTVTLTVTVNIPNRLTTQIVRTATTVDLVGDYSFDRLPGGGTTAYTLTFAAPDATWVRTESDVNGNANDTVDSDGDAALRNQPLGVSDTDEDRDQGYYQNVTVTARVFEEITGEADNQYVDPDDREIASVTVTLERAGGGTTTLDTDVNGLASFTVKPGSYQLNIDENDAQLNGLIASPGNTDPISVTTPLGNPAGQLFSGDESLTDTNGANSFGYYRTSTITGTVFFDRDQNTTKSGDPGVEGVLVELLKGGLVDQSTNTSPTGAYTFTGVVSGTYSLRFSNPDTFNFDFFGGGDSDLAGVAPGDTMATISLGQVTFGSARGDQDAGLKGLATVGGLTFKDADGDGRSNGADDAPLGDVTVALTVTVNIPNRLTTTITRSATTLDATGLYSFTGLVGGGSTTYTVSFTAPNATWVRTDSDVNGNTENDVDSDGDGELRNQSFNAGEQADRDQGYYQYAIITVRVFDEQVTVNNTPEQSEPGIDVATVGISPEDVANNTSKTTGATGEVTFTVKPGPYLLTAPDLTASGFLRSPGNTGSSNVTVQSGATPTVDFGFYKPSTLQGTAWFDSNLDDRLTTGEPGVEGVVVTLRRGDNDAQVGSQQTTDVSGAYAFTNIAPTGITGSPPSYKLCFGTPAGLTYTGQVGALNDDNNSDAGADGCSGTFELPGSSVVSSTIDAGYVGLYSIGDLVWNDEDNDGLQDATESGLADAVVTVAISTSTSINSNGPTLIMTSTLSSVSANLGANYSITGVPPATGFRVVSVSPPPGYVLGQTNQGGNDVSDGDAVGDSFPAVPPSATDTDFGLVAVTSVGDRVWLDLNGNGVYDAATEAGVPGVRVELLSGSVVISDTTTASGAQAGLFAFNNLPPGSYQLRFTAPLGHIFVNDGLGSVLTDGDNDARSDGTTAVFTLSNGEQNFNVDAGLRGTGGIGGIVWVDENRNNVRDTAETTRLEGVQVTLVLTPTLAPSRQLTASATTAADGSYSFADLPPGAAAVTFAQPAGYFPVSPDIGSSDTVDSDGPVARLNLAVGQQSTSVDMGYRTRGFTAFLPLVYGREARAELSASFTVTPASPQGYAPAAITVTITNSGQIAASNFWVDLYINPTRRPRVNDRWNDIPCEAAVTPCQGIAWFYTGRLAPGQSVTLVSTATTDTNPLGYVRNASIWQGSFNNGTSKLYVLVDSWNRNADGSIRDPNGAVLELNEGNNLVERAITVRPGVRPQAETAAPADAPLVDRSTFPR